MRASYNASLVAPLSQARTLIAARAITRAPRARKASGVFVSRHALSPLVCASRAPGVVGDLVSSMMLKNTHIFIKQLFSPTIAISLVSRNNNATTSMPRVALAQYHHSSSLLQRAHLRAHSHLVARKTSSTSYQLNVAYRVIALNNVSSHFFGTQQPSLCVCRRVAISRVILAWLTSLFA